MDRGAWQAVVHGVAESRTRLKGVSTHAYMYTLLYLKRITDKDLLYGTGNSAQCYVEWIPPFKKSLTHPWDFGVLEDLVLFMFWF